MECGTSDTIYGFTVCDQDGLDDRYYSRVPIGVPDATAQLVGGTHNEILEDGNGYCGYDTAWWQYTLKGDWWASFVFKHFEEWDPEIATNSHWQNYQYKFLP